MLGNAIAFLQYSGCRWLFALQKQYLAKASERIPQQTCFVPEGGFEDVNGGFIVLLGRDQSPGLLKHVAEIVMNDTDIRVFWVKGGREDSESLGEDLFCGGEAAVAHINITQVVQGDPHAGVMGAKLPPIDLKTGLDLTPRPFNVTASKE
jgi:hypothetical protein